MCIKADSMCKVRVPLLWKIVISCIATRSSEHNCAVCVVASAALLYSVFGVVIEKARGAEDDINTVAAGTLTGMLFKSASRCFLCCFASGRVPMNLQILQF